MESDGLRPRRTLAPMEKDYPLFPMPCLQRPANLTVTNGNDGVALISPIITYIQIRAPARLLFPKVERPKLPQDIETQRDSDWQENGNIRNCPFPASQPAGKVTSAVRNLATPRPGGNIPMKYRFRLPPIPLFHLEPLEPRRTLNAGFLDPSIVPGGAVTLDLGVDLKHLEFDWQPAIIQPDGKIVVLAEAWGSGADCSPNIDGDIGDLAILFSRFNADGSRDSSFGTDGVATVPCMVDYAYN